MTLQLVASFTIVIYDCQIFIVAATGEERSIGVISGLFEVAFFEVINLIKAGFAESWHWSFQKCHLYRNESNEISPLFYPDSRASAFKGRNISSLCVCVFMGKITFSQNTFK